MDIDPSYEETLFKISYNVAVNTNDWNRSLECLKKFYEQEEDPEFPKDQILTQWAWITYSYIDEITSEEREKR